MDAGRRGRLIERLRGSKTPQMVFGPDSLTRIVAITSGKGGVGKSTVTANLAALAASKGLRVGVIDADVFGFSIPQLFGVAGEKPTRLDDMILPPIGHDVKLMSIGMFVEADTPVSWRGPMLHRTVNQFLTDVYYGDLDLLFVDLPPGTGDVAISLGQLLPHSDVVVVTTPQPSASDVAIRSGLVARQTGQRVVGVIETMSAGSLPGGQAVDLFGSGGGAEVASKLDVPVLGSIPLSIPLRESGDEGQPVVLSHPEDPASIGFHEVLAALDTTRESRVGTPLPGKYELDQPNQVWSGSTTGAGVVRAGAACSSSAESVMASRRMRRGSYCLGSSFFQASGSKSSPSSSLIRPSAPLAIWRTERIKRASFCEYIGRRSGPIKKTASSPIRRSLSKVSPNDTGKE